jgi:hypothetical protein
MLETSVINNRPIDRMRFTFLGVVCPHTVRHDEWNEEDVSSGQLTAEGP